jgi:peroxiredoxin
MKVQVGQKIPEFSVTTLQGDKLMVPDGTPKYTHLQFRRFAGCPICNFHLHTFFKSKAQVEAAGIREIIFFHSSEAEMRKYQKDIAYAVVADPTKKFYARFGVGRSIWAGLDPRALWAATKGMFLGKMGVKIENGPLGLPADILIDRTGTVVAVKYGTHAFDQWEVPELLSYAQAAT